MISFVDVNFSFNQKQVLKDFCCQFDEGKVSCILGPSGCGKTTLLNLIAETLTPNSGSITKPKKISYVFQNDLLIPQQTVLNNLRLVLKGAYKSKTELNSVIDKYLSISGLENVATLYPHQLSGGMRQRIALIRAFAYKSQALLMDEPFNALDISLKSSLIDAFLSLYEIEKQTVIFVTHDIDQALLTADSIFIYTSSMQLMKKIDLPMPKRGRKLFDLSLSQAKDQVLKACDAW